MRKTELLVMEYKQTIMTIITMHNGLILTQTISYLLLRKKKKKKKKAELQQFLKTYFGWQFLGKLGYMQ